jgi:hypothetical protein
VYNFNSAEINLFNRQYNINYTESDINNILKNKLTDIQFNTESDIFKFCLDFYNISEADWNNTDYSIKNNFDLSFNLYYELCDQYNIKPAE